MRLPTGALLPAIVAAASALLLLLPGRASSLVFSKTYLRKLRSLNVDPTGPDLDSWWGTPQGQQERQDRRDPKEAPRKLPPPRQAPSPPQQQQQRRPAELSDATRYLDGHGAAYVGSLAAGRRRPDGRPQPAAPSEPEAAATAAATILSRPEPLPNGLSAAAAANDDEDILALRSDLDVLRAENRAVKSAARDLLRRYYDLAAHLDDMDGHRRENKLEERWEDFLVKCAETFPDEEELESFEWLLRR